MSLSPTWPAALVAFSATWSLAMAQPTMPVEIGVLTCSFYGPGRTEVTDGGVTVQRDVLCTFKLRSGAEETYSGNLLGVSLSGEHKDTLLWLVEVPSAAMAPAPGLLQQSYAPDTKTRAGQLPAMIGEANSDVVLQSLDDKTASPSEEPPAGDYFAILAIKLKLKSTAG